MIHDLELDRVRDPLLEELLADVPERAQERRHGVHDELGDRQEEDGPDHVDLPRPERNGPRQRRVGVDLDRPDDRVDQELRDVGGDRRDDAGDDRRRRQTGREPVARRPDEPEDPRARRRRSRGQPGGPGRAGRGGRSGPRRADPGCPASPSARSRGPASPASCDAGSAIPRGMIGGPLRLGLRSEGRRRSSPPLDLVRSARTRSAR